MEFKRTFRVITNIKTVPCYVESTVLTKQQNGRVCSVQFCPPRQDILSGTLKTKRHLSMKWFGPCVFGRKLSMMSSHIAGMCEVYR